MKTAPAAAPEPPGAARTPVPSASWLLKSATHDLEAARFDAALIDVPPSRKYHEPRLSPRVAIDFAEREERAAERRRLAAVERRRLANYLRPKSSRKKIMPHAGGTFDERHKLAEEASALFEVAFEAAALARPVDLCAFFADHFAQQVLAQQVPSKPSVPQDGEAKQTSSDG